MRARIHGVVAFFVVALVATACQGAGGTTTDGGSTPPSTSETAHPAGGADMGGMDMGGDPHHRHDASLPPLATRLAAATPAQRAVTADLLAHTRAALAPFASEAAARAAGFVPNDETKRLIHYRNFANRRDGHNLDPERPEGLVYLRRPDGTLHLLGAVFTVRPGEAAPTPGGDIFFWHTHQPSCGAFLVPAGTCTDTFRMLHIWTAPSAVDPWIQSPKLAFGRR